MSRSKSARVNISSKMVPGHIPTSVSSHPLSNRTLALGTLTSHQRARTSFHMSSMGTADDDAIMKGYKAWKAMGIGGTSYTWSGYLSCLSAEKTMAFGADDTIRPGFYENPEKVAKGWSQATEAQRANAQKSFLKEPVPMRHGPRARAKPFVFPQRKRNAAEPHDPTVKHVCQYLINCVLERLKLTFTTGIPHLLHPTRHHKRRLRRMEDFGFRKARRCSLPQAIIPTNSFGFANPERNLPYPRHRSFRAWDAQFSRCRGSYCQRMGRETSLEWDGLNTSWVYDGLRPEYGGGDGGFDEDLPGGGGVYGEWVRCMIRLAIEC
jgi:hypothetical protein